MRFASRKRNFLVPVLLVLGDHHKMVIQDGFLNLPTMPSDCGCKGVVLVLSIYSSQTPFNTAETKFLPDRNEAEEVPHISISSAATASIATTQSLAEVPGYRKRYVRRVLQHCSDAASLGYVSLAPSELNRHHRTCTTVPRQLTLPQKNRSRTRCKVFMTPK
ncbi:hypothetical protein TNCV_500561 [Trichonephila clavipes]|nr:hypothetical protein TNCV_500561 [Trichonephila clavipes]